ncbi:MAG TPA: type 4a pilus biogenesis protein PilO [Gaiellaceae bacterium]|jgi:Tfp pilus assembly protein PilO
MSLSKRQIRLIAIFAGINVLLIVAGWMMLVSPQRHDAATAAASALLAQNQLDTSLGQGPGSGSHGPVKQPPINTSCLYKLDTALPSRADQTNLLFELNRVAKSSGVTVISISPQAAQATALNYTVVPVNLSLNGSYFSVTRFLHNLRSLVSDPNGCPVANGPAFGVTSVAMTPGADKDEAPATVSIAAYYYGVTGGATPPASPTDTTTTTTGG